MHQRVGTLLIIIVTALMALAAPALAGDSGRDTGSDRGATAPTYTEDNDTNDRGTPNNVVDDGDNAHPSGRDRSVEPGGSGNQGRSSSDPDDDGRGPDRSNGGADKPNGRGGVDLADQDGNDGCGNDDDFEDDNEGRCGPRERTSTTVRHRTATTVRHQATTTTTRPRTTTTVRDRTTTTVRERTTTTVRRSSGTGIRDRGGPNITTVQRPGTAEPPATPTTVRAPGTVPAVPEVFTPQAPPALTVDLPQTGSSPGLALGGSALVASGSALTVWAAHRRRRFTPPTTSAAPVAPAPGPHTRPGCARVPSSTPPCRVRQHAVDLHWSGTHARSQSSARRCHARELRLPPIRGPSAGRSMVVPTTNR